MAHTFSICVPLAARETQKKKRGGRNGITRKTEEESYVGFPLRMQAED